MPNQAEEVSQAPLPDDFAAAASQTPAPPSDPVPVQPPATTPASKKANAGEGIKAAKFKATMPAR